MDYDANLNAACPVEIVQRARDVDLTSLYMTDILHDAYGLGGPDGDEYACMNAVLAYFTPRINLETDPGFIHQWFGYLLGYFGPLPDALKSDIRAALLRISTGPELSGNYFEVLIRYNIDIRDDLAERVTIDWEAVRNRDDIDWTWDYTRYLAYYKTPGAYEDLAYRMGKAHKNSYSSEGKIRTLFEMAGSLAGMDTPEAWAIIKKYEDDPRPYETMPLRGQEHGERLTVGKGVKRYAKMASMTARLRKIPMKPSGD